MTTSTRLSRCVCGIAIAIAFAAVAPSAFAQENSFTLTCQDVGFIAPEPLGDREGHLITVAENNCHVDLGPLSGGVLTGQYIYEWDKGNGVLISGSGVVRKPGSTVVFRDTEGTLSLVITDGKITGITGSGRGTFPLAVGAGASLAKSWTYTVKSTGPGQSVVEHKGE